MIALSDKRNCCGCTACAAICGHHAITMQPDPEGFLYPTVDTARCTDCHLCEQVCPIVLRDARQPTGLPLRVLALRHKDRATLRSCSSGGAFAAMTQACLDKGGVVYGAEYDEGLTVVHRGEETPAGARRFRGSKYVQSDLRGTFADVRTQLRAGRPVLFSGTPCQVEGLKAFLRRPYDELTTVDILCHGVPSPMVFADYVRFVNRHSVRPLRGIAMKDKTYGWGYQDLRLYFQGGLTEFHTPLSCLWNRVFYDHVANRPACEACRFASFHRPGDVSMGDFWGIEKALPGFASTDGVSLLLVNTPQGEALWQEIKPQFDHAESTPEACRQRALTSPVPLAPDRAQFWQAYHERGFESVARRRYGISRRTLLIGRLRQALSLIRKK